MADTCVDFRSLLEQKDREIIGTHEREVAVLQHRISEQESDYASLENTFYQLQEDFKYNLALLDSRDVELEEYDALLASVEGSLTEKELALEELERLLYKSNTENMQEREQHKVCQKSIIHKICDLEKELERLRQEGEEKIKKQDDSYKTIEQELKTQVLESEKKLLKMELTQTNLLNSFKKQGQISEEFEALRVKLHEIESKLFEFEDKFRKSIDEKSKKLQDLCRDITKSLIEENHARQHYEENLEKLKKDARAAENDRIACISQEIDKFKQLNVQLDNAQARLEHSKNIVMERLLVLSGKMQCMEVEVQDLQDFQANGIQKLENKYLDLIQRHEYFLQEARREASNWKEESDLKQRRCMDLEKRLSQVTKLEAENQHLQENVLVLKNENERMQKVVATLRFEMENLQDATAEENQKTYRNNSEEQSEFR
ncbi:hypothetical protein GOP47_0015173 [Adiantum capillus-veneris]|uniref:Uncharacterized protein n=1 Tax=Adiantum capillus-veneris TaxID=13818 RepID=A0A9D4UMU1_ADICA|nr:hypothetical protein GOP47_0015173 [Adiantum capillus-veneris]